VDEVALNLDALAYCKCFALLFDFTLNYLVYLGIERHVRVVEELLLVDVLPVFKITDLQAV